MTLFVDRGDGVSDEDIFTVGLFGGNLTHVVDQAFMQLHPAWSPDGRDMAYSSSEGIHIRRADGSGSRLAVPHRHGKGFDLYPFWASWSPDGTRLVFAELRLSEEGVYVSSSLQTIKIDGTDRRILARFDHIAYDPRWSPDGRTIAFFSCAGKDLVVRPSNDCFIRTVDATGGTVRTHTDYLEAWDTYPAWTPSGRVIFTSYRSCRPTTDLALCPEIYQMDRDGSGLQRIAGHGDWTGDGIGDHFVRMEPSGDPRLYLVLLTSGDGSAESSLWLWNRESGERRKVFGAGITADFDWQPVCNVTGSRGDDVLRGTPSRDLICGLGGDDTIRGLGGDDVVFGHDGRDRLIGGTGRDIVVGNGGRDRCDRDERDYSRVC